jgi:diguanylate cyclase (GGDEF)-like protein
MSVGRYKKTGGMLTTTASVNDALRELRERYQKSLPARLDEIGALWEAMQLAEITDAEKVQTLYRHVHGLTGSGATFGLTALSDASRILEATIKQDMINAERLTGEVCDRIQAQWRDVKLAAYRPDVEASTAVEQAVQTANAPLSAKPVVPAKNEKASILLVEDDIEQARNLELQLGHFGYAVKVLHDPSSLNATVAEMAPSVIIMDMVFPGCGLSGNLAIAGLSDEVKDAVPVIFLSVNRDLNSRLSAVRAGAVAYLTKPVEIGLLIDQLDKLTNADSLDPFKVLVIDDSSSLASYYSLTLQAAGMDVRVVTDPLTMLDSLKDFVPELILMDMYMPGCNGLELAKVIRQQEEYVSTPIVFLSAEKNIEKHLEALQLGADDFLTKPIQAAHLVSSVTSRVQRYRTLRTFMVKDSLTGLLNHTKLKEELDVEIMRAQRQKSKLVFAMIDIDFFKNVNDNYGHATGDRVIKSLSRLLQQRLRKTDIVGRYGGEEFAVILRDSDGASAFAALDHIRIAFEQIKQHSDIGEFSVTFSCGLAEFPVISSSAKELSSAADRALYEAKREGRNRVVVAGAAVEK